MSSALWWTLAASIFVAIFIMILTIIIVNVKIQKIKRQYSKDIALSTSEVSKAIIKRENHGELLWELKSQSKNPLSDTSLEFLINTMIRNSYKNFYVVNSHSDYEKKSFEKIGKAQSSITNSEFVLIFNNQDVNNQFDEYFKKIKAGNMIAIVNAPIKNKAVKKLIKHLKITKIKYDWLNIDKGIVLIVK